MTSRPAYVPHVGQTRCGRRGLWQRGHSFSRGAEALCWARRLSRRVRDCLFLGTAMRGGRIAAARLLLLVLLALLLRGRRRTLVLLLLLALGLSGRRRGGS